VDIFRRNKKAIFFVLKFVGIYLVLNTLYSLYIQSCYPKVDPITQLVANQTSWVLSLLGEQVNAIPSNEDASTKLIRSGIGVIDVYEGCNGVNVMIVFFSFLAAYSGSIKRLFIFSPLGITILYIANIGRVMSLYGIALYYPEYLYLFHKYVLTAGLYLIVFLLWYQWTLYSGKDE
jgi:exosortase family protein XrtF